MNMRKAKKMYKSGTLIAVEGTGCVFMSLGLYGDGSIDSFNGVNIRTKELVSRCSGKGRSATKKECNAYWSVIKDHVAGKLKKTSSRPGKELDMSLSRDSLQMIPVEERLPLENLRVLCRMKSNGQIVSGYLFKQNGKVCVATDPDFHFEDNEDYEATHWFPMFDAKGIDPDDVCPCKVD